MPSWKEIKKKMCLLFRVELINSDRIEIYCRKKSTAINYKKLKIYINKHY